MIYKIAEISFFRSTIKIIRLSIRFPDASFTLLFHHILIILFLLATLLTLLVRPSLLFLQLTGQWFDAILTGLLFFFQYSLLFINVFQLLEIDDEVNGTMVTALHISQDL